MSSFQRAGCPAFGAASPRTLCLPCGDRGTRQHSSRSSCSITFELLPLIYERRAMSKVRLELPGEQSMGSSQQSPGPAIASAFGSGHARSVPDLQACFSSRRVPVLWIPPPIGNASVRSVLRDCDAWLCSLCLCRLISQFANSSLQQAASKSDGRGSVRFNPSLGSSRSGMDHRPSRARYHGALASRWALPPRSAQFKR